MMVNMSSLTTRNSDAVGDTTCVVLNTEIQDKAYPENRGSLSVSISRVLFEQNPSFRAYTVAIREILGRLFDVI